MVIFGDVTTEGFNWYVGLSIAIMLLPVFPVIAVLNRSRSRRLLQGTLRSTPGNSIVTLEVFKSTERNDVLLHAYYFANNMAVIVAVIIIALAFVMFYQGTEETYLYAPHCFIVVLTGALRELNRLVAEAPLRRVE